MAQGRRGYATGDDGTIWELTRKEEVGCLEDKMTVLKLATHVSSARQNSADGEPKREEGLSSPPAHLAPSHWL
jgi:hypothetical protein